MYYIQTLGSAIPSVSAPMSFPGPALCESQHVLSGLPCAEYVHPAQHAVGQPEPAHPRKPAPVSMAVSSPGLLAAEVLFSYHTRPLGVCAHHIECVIATDLVRPRAGACPHYVYTCRVDTRSDQISWL